MRLLAFLLIGTLIFGFAFPAAIFLVGLAGLAILALLIAGLLRGGGVKVYTAGNNDLFRNKRDGERDPSVIDTTQETMDSDCNSEAVNQPDFDEESEGEIVELPATALRKEDQKSLPIASKRRKASSTPPATASALSLIEKQWSGSFLASISPVTISSFFCNFYHSTQG